MARISDSHVYFKVPVKITPIKLIYVVVAVFGIANG